MARRRIQQALPLVLALAVALSALVGTSPSAFARPGDHAIYTMTNAADGNEVVRFDGAADGSLTETGRFATGGAGNGGGLGSQGALVLSRDGRWLLAVNAGSNEISAFRVTGNRLTLTSTVPSGGEMPISVTINGDLVYVLNAGGAGNITGFTIAPNGNLSQIDDSTRSLSGGGVGPAQVQFTPDGSKLVVTEKTTNLIDVYFVGTGGLAGGPVVSPSAGATPFGFEFTPDGTLLVSEAFGGAPNASAISAYQINTNGTLTVLDGAVPTMQTAACWVVVTPDGRYVYTTNTGSASVSGFDIGGNGDLTLLDGNGVTGMTGGGPIDAIIAAGFLYTLNSGADSISIFAINDDGSLTSAGTVSGLAASAVGITGR